MVDPGWQARVTDHNHLMLRRTEARPRAPGATTDVDPVMLELFNNLFMSIAEQMGERLRATANSVNIKERLDFSCALFDTDGHLIANAPHMPVHLGSMGESIKAVIEANAGRMRPGDSYVLNNPYRGGTHLPDITVVTPVFDETRAHPVLRRLSRPPRRGRWHHTGLDALLQPPGRGGRRPDRQRPAHPGRQDARRGDARAC